VDVKLGVLIGGSDAPGLNAVIRAVVRTAVFRYRSDVVGVSHGFEGLLSPPELWPLGPADVRGLSRRGGAILGSCNRGSPFSSDGRDRSAEVLENIRWLGIDALVCIGGDGSLAIADRLHQLGVPIVGIPKTVENDLAGTGVTFGYASAVETAVEAIDKLHTSRESQHRVMFIEVVGRRAGWIALSAGLAGAADVILIPEIPYRVEVVAQVIKDRAAQGKHSTIIVVAEAAREAGEPLATDDEVRRRRGVAAEVAAKVSALCQVDDRVTLLGQLQRGGTPNSQDRILATRFGAAAVKAAHEGRFGQMVGISGSKVVLVPLARAVGTVKAVDPQGELVWTAASVGTSFGITQEELAALAVPAPAPAAR
jgi:6-phosphofructokinase 1